MSRCRTDLRASGRDDSKKLSCDAFSAGLRLDTYVVTTAGAFADLPAMEPRCVKDGGVPAGDDCPPPSP